MDSKPATDTSKGDFPQIAHRKKRAFLSAFAVTGTISGAAKASGISRRSHSSWMKQQSYADAFAIAQDIAADALEGEARRRAIDGVCRPVLYKGEQVSVTDPRTGKPSLLFEHEYSTP